MIIKETSFSVTNDNVDFGCLQGINTCISNNQYGTTTTMGSSVGSSDRAIRINNNGAAGLLSFKWGYFFDPATDITQTWVADTIFSNRNLVFPTDHWVYGYREVLSLIHISEPTRPY